MDDNRIAANNSTLMRQASMTASTYLDAAVNAVEEQFGTGGAITYPQLVAAHMHAAAMDFGASVIARALDSLTDRDASSRTD